jgi:ABC-2 type transport system permease protein
MKAFKKLLVADFKQFFRDRTAVFFTFAFPILIMVIFGLVFSDEGDITYKIGLVNEDNSVIGDNISGVLQEIPVFEVTEGNLDDKLKELEDGDISAVIVIPTGVSQSVAIGQTADIIIYYDPSQTTSSQIILSVLDQTINEINRQITQQPVLLELAEESIQSQTLRSVDYLVPGIVAMSAMFLGLFGSLGLVEWREKKILKRFGATPLHRSTMIYSQIVYRLILALVQTVILIAIAFFLFNVQVLGNWFLLFGLVILGTLVFISLGYLVVSRVKTVEGAMPIIQLVQFPMLFLSGIFFPLELMPDFMRPIVEALPLTFLGDSLRQVMVDATPYHPMGLDVAVLVGWLVVCMVLSIRFFKWE